MKGRFKTVLPIMFFLSLIIAGCDGNSIKISDKNIKNDSQVKVSDLLKYKNSYIGDNSAVGSIISKLPGNAYSAGFSLETKNAPYEVIINYKPNNSSKAGEYDSFWSSKKPSEFLEKNAVVFFALIKNADVVQFNVEDVGDKNYKYNRKDLEKKYGTDLKKIFKDEDSSLNFLNE